MTLVRHTITAIERDQADATASGKQVVAGAVVTMTDSGGSAYQMADNAAGANASTSKTTNSDGQVTVYVEPGQYTVTVNGISSGITVGNGFEVTQSPTDATAGRLLKVGDFGVGGYITLSAVSLDTIDQVTGFYYCINCTDRPAAINGYMDVYVNSPGSFAKQTYSAIGDSRTWIRTLFSGTWSDWIPVATEDNNALIEFGSNANGSFTKFPDGTLVCVFADSGNSLSAGQNASYTWLFPSSFISTPTVTGSSSISFSVSFEQSSLVIDNSAGTNVNQSRYAIKNNSGSTQTIKANLTAIGRWK
ncbi:MAG: pyocin knob domain-containing protein [Glaciecola sp.]|jgi:hypothetical protein